MLGAEIGSCKRVHLVVDALDECSFRQKLVPDLCSLHPERTSLMITSRPIDGEFAAPAISCNPCGPSEQEHTVHYRCEICEGDFDICQSYKDAGRYCNDRSHTLFEPDDQVEVVIRTPDLDLRRYVEYIMKQELITFMG